MSEKRFVSKWNGREWEMTFMGHYKLSLPQGIKNKKYLGTLEQSHNSWIRDNIWWIEESLDEIGYLNAIRGTLLTEIYANIQDVEKERKQLEEYKKYLKWYVTNTTPVVVLINCY